MSEKEFRVWDKDLKKMFYSAFSITSYGDVVDAGWKEEVGMTEEGYYSHEIRGGIDCIVMQSTGLLDKDNEMIWESDIVKHQYEKGVAVVKFGEGYQGEPADGMYPYWGWYTDGWIQRYAFGEDELEIIGNIYENPDIVV